ncbi:AAA domain-containing protein [Puerhibacterium sp. TATVAM-FAB25]|uniref:AAA domain-containing protein n=1 Tax=Puerhibacterium sp. TATVAM-FAB25 TaxID=3093699 RepID=UPI00397C4E2C
MQQSSRDGEGRPVLTQSSDLLEYLAAVAREVGPKPVLDVTAHPFTLWPADIPHHRAIRVGPTDTRASWLEVERVSEPAPVTIPGALHGLIDPSSCRTPDAAPQLDEEAVARYARARAVEEYPGSDPADEAERSEYAEAERDDVRHQFTAWLTGTWGAWVDTARPTFAARALYARLYDLRLRAEADSATLEVIWGHAVLSYRGADGPILAPLLTTAVTLEVDPDDATIRIGPEGTVELELDGVAGSGIPGMGELVNLRATLRSAPPDPWSTEERAVTRGQMLSGLGGAAALVDSPDPLPVTPTPTVNDGWVLFLRKRPLRQERFYDELSAKILDEEFVPEALASVVADKDRVDAALSELGRPTDVDDHTADRLLMPLPANQEQERIARQLAGSRGVTVQGPPGTGKSHTIVNLISHLVAQGKRVLVTAEKEQALSVLRDKIPEPLRDLSLAVLTSTPAAMEEMRGAVQSMQDSLAGLDVDKEARRIAELGARVDTLRESLLRIDADLVEALRSEQREYPLPGGQAKAPEVAQWLATDRHLDVVEDRVPLDSPPPLTLAELDELAHLLAAVTTQDAEASVLDLPVEAWLPTAADLHARFERLEQLRTQVTALEDSGLRVETLDGTDLASLRRVADELRAAAGEARSLAGEWEDRFAAATRASAHPGGEGAVGWVVQHNPAVLNKLATANQTASRLAGHTITVPDGDPNTQLGLLQEWRKPVEAGKKLSMFARRELKELAAAVRVDGYPVSTPAHLDLVAGQVRLRTTLREARTLMDQAYAPCAIPVPEDEPGFLFAAEQLARRVAAVHAWWSQSYPRLATQLAAVVTLPDPALTPRSLEHIAGLYDGAAARLEERRLAAELEDLTQHVAERGRPAGASSLWPALRSALDLAQSDAWDAALTEARRLLAVRAQVLRSRGLAERIAQGGAPRWASAIVESRGDHAVVGEVEDYPTAWERAKARTWLLALHAQADVPALMNRSHAESIELQATIVDLAARSARVELKRNMRDGQRVALERWLHAIKKAGKGLGKNAPRLLAAAREELPEAMGAVPIWIMPIYRVMENFDPRVSELFDVVVVDESSQCDLLSLGVLALGKKAVVVGDDKQTTPQRVGILTERIAELQDQHLRGLRGARLLTLDESLYSISTRAFPSTIALREHFRCVPEIIEFSNRYYNGAIRPLREVTRPELGDPIRLVHVPGALSVDKGQGRTNLEEARAIADQVAACAADPAYDGLTFGVVTMMSGPQAQHIQNAIQTRLDTAEFERRRIRVGNPPAFQGDERHVMFVSMVAHDNSFQATRPMYHQWANVAASRAQDQLWIFHSMDPTTLHPDDQRRAMIQYAQSYDRRQDAGDLYELTESQFERDVLAQMLERGYDVEPQHRAGSYRIDFVVNVAPGERLAIECDGDAFHGPDKWADDVLRQRVLERIGWTFWRVRASEYYYDPEAAMRPLWERLETMCRRAATAEDIRRARQVAVAEMRLHDLRQEAIAHVATSSEPADYASDPAEAALRAMFEEPDSEVRPAPAPRAAGPMPEARRAATPGGAPNAAEVRAWARANGYTIGDRGVLSQHVKDAYMKAMEAGSAASTDAAREVTG